MAQGNIAPDTFKRVLAGKAALNEFLGLSSDQIDAIAALGFSFYTQGRIRDAEVIFEGLTALDSSIAYGYAGLGAIALAHEPPDLERAYENLSRAAQLNPKDPTVMANLGETLLRQAKFEEAAEAFERALALDPEEQDLGANRARAIINGIEIVMEEVQKVQAGS